MARPSRIKLTYLKSHLFWWGVGLLAVAAFLMGWNAIRDATAPMPGDLQTIEGTLIDYRGGKASMPHAGRPGKRQRGRGRGANILRIEKLDGTIAEFSLRDWIKPPKAGWRKGQPVRVKHDARGSLYEVVIGNETLRDLATTMERREAERANMERIAVFLFVIGGALTVARYLASRQGKARPPRS